MSLSGLMLHCGSTARSLNEIRAIPTPPPVRSEGSEKRKGSLHVPITHATLYDMVKSDLEKATKYHVVNEAFGASDDGAKFFGLMEVRNGYQADDHGLVIGLRNSHDKTFPGGIVVGSSVFVCDNLSFSGEIKVTRKHTTNIMRDLPGIVFSAIGKIQGAVDFQALRFDAYKGTSIDTTQADHLLMNAWREGILSTRTLATARDEWDAPSHSEFEERNVWSLFNDCTESFKGKGGRLFNGIDRETLALHSFLDRACGLESYEDFCKRVNATPEEEEVEVEEADFAMLN